MKVSEKRTGKSECIKRVNLSLEDGSKFDFIPKAPDKGCIVAFVDETGDEAEAKIFINARPAHLAHVVDAIVRHNPQILNRLLLMALAEMSEKAADKALEQPAGGNA